LSDTLRDALDDVEDADDELRFFNHELSFRMRLELVFLTVLDGLGFANDRDSVRGVDEMDEASTVAAIGRVVLLLRLLRLTFVPSATFSLLSLSKRL